MNSLPRDPKLTVFLTRAICLALMLLFSTMDASGQKKPALLVVSLSADHAEYHVGQAVELTFTVKNEHKKAQEFCRYMTPFEGFNGSILEVLDSEGKALTYHGVMKKRGKPDKDDFIKLGPGESKSVSFDLNKPYPITEAGSYKVKFKGSKYQNKLNDSNVVEIKVLD